VAVKAGNVELVADCVGRGRAACRVTLYLCAESRVGAVGTEYFVQVFRITAWTVLVHEPQQAV
jgi:hypothetical protein